METLPDFLLNEKSVVAVLFTIVAALASIFSERKNKTARRNSDHQSSELIQKAFDQMEKNVDELRKRNDELRRDCKKFSEEAENFRQKYYNEIEKTIDN